MYLSSSLGKFTSPIQPLKCKYLVKKIFNLQENISRWKRRFGNRADADSPDDEESPAEVLEETVALGRAGANIQLLSNKIYPGHQEAAGKDKVESQY